MSYFTNKKCKFSFPVHILLYGILFSFILSNNKIQAQNDTILIDCGSNSNLSNAPWNNLISPTNGAISNLINSQNQPTGIAIAVNDAFNEVNSQGTTTPDVSIGFPSTATVDAFYGNTALFNSKIEPTGGIVLSNLKPEKTYKIIIFTSRGIVTDNRETMYIIKGIKNDTLYLNPSGNTSTTVSVSAIPNTDGKINIVCQPGKNNNNVSGFYYLGALKLIYEHEVLPSVLSLRSPMGGEFWQIGKKPYIIWKSQAILNVTLEYSIDNGSTWIAIKTVAATLQKYLWTIPANASKNCLVRITSGELVSVSANPFQIADDVISSQIVVLGSSTSAGNGPPVVDSAWVWKYRAAIFQRNTRFSVTNLAVGGFSTGDVLPSGDGLHNITKALSLNPCAIIMNLPTNDAAYNNSVALQLQRYKTIMDLASKNNVKFWVTTTQPRNFTDATQLKNLMDMRDSIIARYGTYVIDFWTDLANTDGTINSQYNSGDGIHLNTAGHEILTERALAKSIDTIDFTRNCPVSQPFLAVNKGAQQQISTITINLNDTLTMSPLPTIGTWKWSGPNSYTSILRTVKFNKIQLNQGGTYIAKFISTNGCVSSQNYVITVNDNTLLPTEIANDISYYPNPVLNILTIKSIPSNTTITVLDINGHSLMYNKIQSNNEETKIDLSNLNPGIYYIELKNEKSSTFKIIKN